MVGPQINLPFRVLLVRLSTVEVQKTLEPMVFGRLDLQNQSTHLKTYSILVFNTGKLALYLKKFTNFIIVSVI